MPEPNPQEKLLVRLRFGGAYQSAAACAKNSLSRETPSYTSNSNCSPLATPKVTTLNKQQ